MRNVVFGAGGFGREVATMLRNRDVPNIVFAADDVADSAQMLGCTVVPSDTIDADDIVYLAIGSGAARAEIAARLAASGCRFDPLIAASAIVTSNAIVGSGAVFSDFTMVTAPVLIGLHFQCNIYSYVAHDCEIGDYVTFAPRVSCNGSVRIGDHAYIGTNATIRQGITIGARAVVGMGAVVVKDVPEDAIVMGNPARER